MSQITYEASVYTRTVSYKNFLGEVKTVELYFALDPIQLLTVIGGFEPKKIKSGNPALNGRPSEISDEQQIQFVRDLATKAAGTPSKDGETWTPWQDFGDDLAGKAFLTQLVASDKDRREFAEKVLLAPFKSFVRFAEQDESNSPAEVQQFKTMLGQLENIFKMPTIKDESVEDRRARLAAELASLDTTPPAEL